MFSLRILTGFVVPILFWVFAGTDLYGLIVASILTGEVVDRAEFYMDLDFTHPSAQARHDLATMVAYKPLVLG